MANEHGGGLRELDQERVEDGEALLEHEWVSVGRQVLDQGLDEAVIEVGLLLGPNDVVFYVF